MGHSVNDDLDDVRHVVGTMQEIARFVDAFCSLEVQEAAERAGGFLLLGAAMLALILAETPLAWLHGGCSAPPWPFRSGELKIAICAVWRWVAATQETGRG